MALDTSIDSALVNAYRSNIELKFQQMGSRLRPAVRLETQHAEFEFYDRIGPTDAVQVVNRHSDTPLVPTVYDRRRVGLTDWDWADLIDNKDRLRMLADPTSAYCMNAVYALGRAMDDVVIAAAFGTAYADKQGNTSITFPSSNVVAANYVEAGTAANSNLTIGKLRRVRYLLDKAEAANEGEHELYAAVDPSQLQSLLRTTEVTNSQYNEIKALVHGEVDTFMGFNFIRTNRLPFGVTASNIRNCIFWEKQGLLLSMAQEVMVDVGPRRDKRNSIQVYVCGSFGASRMWEEKVYEVNCDETA